MVKIKEKRGFTLVELIVVLVILAILAALLVPALTGYIDKAKKSQVIAETRMIVQAVQTEVVELYPTGEYTKQLAYTTLFTIASDDGRSVLDGEASHKQIIQNLKKRFDSIAALAEVSSITNGAGHFMSVVDLSGKVHLVIYNDGKGYLGLYFANGSEYMAIKCENGVSDSNYVTYKNEVIGTNTTQTHDSEDESPFYFWDKPFVLLTIGYRNSLT
ncbi:type II secretion system protein [Gemmiger sp.]